MRPVPGETICDPACGTGGFLLASTDYIAEHFALDSDQMRHLKLNALPGVELVDGVTRLCAMNLLLHGTGPTSEESDLAIRTADSLAADPGKRFDLVPTNSPFGKMSSMLTITEGGEQEWETLTIVRNDFWTSTSNKQLNFVQQINLWCHPRCAVRYSPRAARCSSVRRWPASCRMRCQRGPASKP